MFCRKWFELVEEFGVQDKPWIIDMYEKRHLWATAHIRGKFFAGFRTTSRCEGFHFVIARYVKSKYNLSEFLENFQSCVGYMRFKEIGADFDSARGVPVMQTCLEPLERFADNVYTRAVFGLFRPILVRAGTMKVLDSKEAGSYITYVVCKYGKPNDEWHVDFCEEEMMFKCSCLRMESFGIPCEHIVAVLVYRDICELSKSLVLHRWTKQAKAAIHDGGGFSWDSLVNCQCAALMECCKQMAVAAAPKTERFHESRDLVLGLFAAYTAEDEAEQRMVGEVAAHCEVGPSNPRTCRTKGRSGQASRRKPQRCSICRMVGHNNTSCAVRRDIANCANGVNRSGLSIKAEVEEDVYSEDIYGEMVSS